MTIPRPEYPRMQFRRDEWLNLNGQWSCEFDYGQSGLDRKRQVSSGYNTPIVVPFCPESSLSGIGHKDFINSMFYHRKLEIPAAWRNRCVRLNFGAVDYDCAVYLDGELVGKHFGGSVSFSFDLTAFLKPEQTVYDLTMYVCDLPRRGVQPVGKQALAYESSGCNYTRVSGIWQTVWLEPVAECGLKQCKVIPDLDNGSLGFIPEFYQVKRNQKLAIRVLAEGREVAQGCFGANNGSSFNLTLSEVRAWSPSDPFLYDIEYRVYDENDVLLDEVASYTGLRKIHIEGDKFFLNNERIFLRLVLDQGYYEEGIWTAPSDEALKNDIELSMQVGFNGARLHQKVFEERFHYWADKLGYLTWGETASWGLDLNGNGICCDNTNQYEAIFNFLSEWRQIVERDFNHPSIITWTPLNETHVPLDHGLERYRRMVTEIYDLTRSIDPTRPVNETSGYIHVKTDLWTVHLYCKDAEELKGKLLGENGEGVYYTGRAGECRYSGQPYINDEFGGFMYIPADRKQFAENTWGYHGMEFKSPEELANKIDESVQVMLDMENLSGYCYTQLTDVEQEQNGIYNYDRTEKGDSKLFATIFGRKPEWSRW